MANALHVLLLIHLQYLLQVQVWGQIYIVVVVQLDSNSTHKRFANIVLMVNTPQRLDLRALHVLLVNTPSTITSEE